MQNWPLWSAATQPKAKRSPRNSVFHTVIRMSAALFKDGGVDALVVCTANVAHLTQSLAALQAGVAVMVEKPMAMNAAEAGTMIEASLHAHVPLMVAHCWRFDPEVQWLRTQVQSGTLGEIVHTTGYGVHVAWGPSGWFIRKAEAGGGALADMGIHAIDTTRYLLGDPQPRSVYAHISTRYIDADVDDTGLIWITWDNGTISYIESGWWQPHANGPEAAVELYGTRGYGRTFPAYLDLPKPERTELVRVESGFPAVRKEHAPQSLYNDQMAYFLHCVESGDQPNPGGEEGLVNMRIVDTAYQSARTGQVVELE